MKKSELVEKVKELMIGLKTYEALDLLHEYVKNEDKDLEAAIIMQKAAHNRAKQNSIMMGTLGADDFARTVAKINYAILQILEQVPEKATVDLGGSHIEKATHGKVKILFLTANPKGSTPLRLNEEIRKVRDGFRSATHRDRFDFVSEPAVRVPTITAAMMQQKPNIVHFSGHGVGIKGLVVEGSDGHEVLFPTDGLKKLFGLFKEEVKCVVLNACYSQEQAIAISQEGIYVVGMNDAIGDKAAIEFAVGFYQAIGEGYDYQFAFDMGTIVTSVNLSDAHKPELWFNGEKIK